MQTENEGESELRGIQSTPKLVKENLKNDSVPQSVSESCSMQSDANKAKFNTLYFLNLGFAWFPKTTNYLG